MNRTHLWLATAGVTLLLSFRAGAQAPPFFNGGGGIFDPEIGVVQSGVILDAQAVVSADRKYVTLTTRFQNAQLLALREFAFQTGGGGAGQAGGGGVAGGAGAANVNGFGAEDAGRGERAQLPGSASQHAGARRPYPAPGRARAPLGDDQTSVLDKQGMTLVGRIGSARSNR